MSKCATGIILILIEDWMIFMFIAIFPFEISSVFIQKSYFIEKQICILFIFMKRIRCLHKISNQFGILFNTIKNSSVLIVKIQIALEFASIVLCVFFPNPAFYRAISILTLIIHFKRWLWNCINTYLFRSWSSAHDRLMFVAAFVVYDWCF